MICVIIWHVSRNATVKYLEIDMEKLFIITETWGRYEEATVTNVGVALTEERAQQEVERLTQLQSNAIKEYQDFEQEIVGPLRATPEYRSYVYGPGKITIDELLEFAVKQLGDKWREFHEKWGHEVPEITYNAIFIRRRPNDYVFEYEEVPVID